MSCRCSHLRVGGNCAHGTWMHLEFVDSLLEAETTKFSVNLTFNLQKFPVEIIMSYLIVENTRLIIDFCILDSFRINVTPRNTISPCILCFRNLIYFTDDIPMASITPYAVTGDVQKPSRDPVDVKTKNVTIEHTAKPGIY